MQEKLLTFILLCVFSAHSYFNRWDKVANCTGITHTYCDLSGLIHDYNRGYKVQVQLVAGQSSSVWIKKKFLINTSRCSVKSAPRATTLRLLELLFISTHHLSCRQTAAPHLHFIPYIQLSNSSCPQKTHFKQTLSLRGHLHHLSEAERWRQKGDYN